MAEGSFQQLPWFVSQEDVRQPNTVSSAPLSYPEPIPESSKPFQRRHSSFPANPTPSSSVEKSKSAVRRRSTSKAVQLSSREGPSRASLGIMNDPASEITYTPTTHRISKAKKGKKVHACEYPGCTKVRLIRNSQSSRSRLIRNSRFLPEQSIESKTRWGWASRKAVRLTLDVG